MRVKSFLIIVYFSVMAGWNAHAATIDISINTSGISGTAAQMAFDFVGINPAVNTATITSFSTDGVLGAASTAGGPVSGTLPGSVAIADTFFFNELLQDITLGGFIQFTVEITDLFTGGSLPDQFSFFLFDPFFTPLVPTSDPTATDALLAFDVTGAAAGDLAVFSPQSTGLSWTATAQASSTTPIPEPATIWLCGSALTALWLRRRNARG